jgi:hypothetical protein
MSLLREESQAMPAKSKADFASAALRHVRDAEFLLRPEAASRDQAWHLAGFAHECARKAYVGGSWVPKLLGHDFSSAGEVVLDVAVALDPRSGRFPLRSWSNDHDAVSAWIPDHRYERTGSCDKDPTRDVENLVKQARAATDRCILLLFLDGSLETESLR